MTNSEYSFLVERALDILEYQGYFPSKFTYKVYKERDSALIVINDHFVELSASQICMNLLDWNAIFDKSKQRITEITHEERIALIKSINRLEEMDIGEVQFTRKLGKLSQKDLNTRFGLQK
jgi:hypothetical protein